MCRVPALRAFSPNPSRSCPSLLLSIRMIRSHSYHPTLRRSRRFTSRERLSKRVQMTLEIPQGLFLGAQGAETDLFPKPL